MVNGNAMQLEELNTFFLFFETPRDELAIKYLAISTFLQNEHTHQLGRDGISFNMINSLYKKSTASFILNVENESLRLGTR